MTGAERAPLLRIRRGASGEFGAGGWLIVEPGAVRFEIAGVHRTAARLMSHVELPAVIHAKGPLVLKRARLLPPGLNTGLIIKGDEGVITVLTWGFMLGRLRDALARAGVELIEEPTWISIGVAEGRAALYETRRPPGQG